MGGQLNLEKSAKIIKWGRDNLFSKWFSENWILICKRMKLDPDFTLYTKIHSKWIKDLNIRFKSIKLLKESIQGNLYDIGFVNNYLDMKSKTQRKEKR